MSIAARHGCSVGCLDVQDNRGARSRGPRPNGVAKIRLARKPAVIQEALLLRRHRAPEDRVAMREATEAADDVAVSFGMRESGLAETPVERHRQLLMGDILRMGEG